jgi:hypothetical protein
MKVHLNTKDEGDGRSNCLRQLHASPFQPDLKRKGRTDDNAVMSAEQARETMDRLSKQEFVA